MIAGNSGSADEKMRVLEQCGIHTVRMSDLIGETLLQALRDAGLYNLCNTVKGEINTK